MRTAIFTYKNPTKLSIETADNALNLVEIDHQNAPIVLRRGKNEIDLRAGVYKLSSQNRVNVTGNPDEFEFQFTVNDKTEFPDPPKKPNTRLVEIRAFFLNDKDAKAPE